MRVGPTGVLALALLSSVGSGCSHWIVDEGRHGDEFDSIVASVEKSRGGVARRPIDVRIVTPSEMRRVIQEVLASQRDAEELADYEFGLATVGLWPRDRSLMEEYVAVMGEEVAGLYVPELSALFVVSDISVPVSEWLTSVLERRDQEAAFVLTHELVHLLQHQEHPELFDPATLADQDDAAIALQAAFEGEAMFSGMVAMGSPLPAPEVIDDAFATAVLDETGALANAPALIRGLIGFPYAQGYRLAAGGAADLLRDPPASTEQALQGRPHASFEVFDLSDLSSVLPEGCQAVHENTVGALQLSILFGDLSDPSPADGVDVEHPEGLEMDAVLDGEPWEGWNGDRYLAARCHGTPALLWLTSWDSEGDAGQFAAAYRGIAQAVARRASLSQPVSVSRQGAQVVVRSPELAGLEELLDERVARTSVRSLAELRAAFRTR